MPTDHVTTSYAPIAIAHPTPPKPLPGERASHGSALSATSVEARYHRARRVIDDDSRSVAASRRPQHGCAMLNTIADHHIETIASYLTPRDRMNLRHAARRLNWALRADAAMDRLTVKIDKVFSPSLLRRALAETSGFPAERPSLLAMLAGQVRLFCPPHARRGIRLVLAAIEQLPADQRAEPLASLGPLLRVGTSDLGAAHPETRAIEDRVMEAVQHLPANIRGRTLAAVLSAGFTVPPQRPAKVHELVAPLDQYPPADRAALLRALTEQFDHRNGAPDQGTWHMLVELALALPADCQAEPLLALASHPTMPLHLAKERWDHLMHVSFGLHDASRAAIYCGLARTLTRLPNVRCDPETRQRVQWLNGAIASLPGALLPAVLTELARNILRANFADCWDGVVAGVRKLPVEHRLAPLRALVSAMWGAPRRDNAMSFSDTLLDAARELRPDDLSVLLGDAARKTGTLGELNRLFDACLELPLALRRWTLAALAAKPCWVLADNARPIADVLLPMIDGMDGSHRATIVLALLRTAFNCKDTCPEDVPTRRMPAATWKALNGSFDRLPPECREQVLIRMARYIRDPMTPAWNWVLQSTRRLPASRQPLVLRQLASASYLTDTPGNIRPIRMVAAVAAALPRHYRAVPLWAVQRAKNNADETMFNVISYLQCCWSIFRLDSRLPEDDRF